MKWKKLGLVFSMADAPDWVKTHAWVPTADPLGGGLFRVYFAGRNADNLSQVGSFTVHLDNPTELVEVSPTPHLELGPLGSFDDSAVLPTLVLNRDKKKFLYYVGWMQGKRVPFYASVGVAVSHDGGQRFERCSQAPLLPRSEVDPFFTAAAFVLEDQEIWRMWYTTNTKWRLIDGQPLPRYHIKYAESSDGINWKRDGHVAINFEDDSEYAISRPWVIREDGIYKMWYSYRGESYRIGYAESINGRDWTRKDHLVGIDVSPSGWDSEMIEYGSIVDHNGKRFMFYNGNQFGYDGVGLAVLD
jgi:hypothetical protein